MKTTHLSKSNPINGDVSPVPVLAAEAALSTLRSRTGLVSRAWGWLKARHVVRSNIRRLRVAETVSLGEKRFVAVVEVDGRHFLLAGGPTNIVLLAQLDAKETFGDVLKKTLTAPAKKVAKRKRPANFAMQAQVNKTNSREDVPRKATTARRKQPAKQASSQNPFAPSPASAPLTTHLNGTENFGDVLQRAAASRQPTNHAGKQNSKSTTGQGYFA
jgi:flagellar biogenesis protein FliO